MTRFAALALALLLSGCGGGGSSSAPHDTVRLSIRNDRLAPVVIDQAGWRPFRFHGDGLGYETTDWTGDPILPGETRFWIELPYDPLGYSLAYSTNETADWAEEAYGLDLEGDFTLVAD